MKIFTRNFGIFGLFRSYAYRVIQSTMITNKTNNIMISAISMIQPGFIVIQNVYLFLEENIAMIYAT